MNWDVSYARGSRWLLGLLIFLGLSLAIGPVNAGGKPKLTVSKASWSAKKGGSLTIKAKLKNGAANAGIELFGIDGSRLQNTAANTINIVIPKGQLPAVPCAIRAESGDLEVIKQVVGAPKDCKLAPLCSITVAPAPGTVVAVNQDVHFEATDTLKDTTGTPKYEWDFAGGAMGELVPGSNPTAYKRPDTKSTTVQFVRDNSRYRVRFSVMDGQKRRCQDTVEVVVGTPPNTGLPKVAEQTAAQLGEQITQANSTQGKLVVLPYEDWTFQNASDMKLNPNGYSSFNPVVNNLKAVVYSKDKKPPVVGDSAATSGAPAVNLQYSAASNPSDPAGQDSINSTSQNWPLDKSLADASIKKGDMWEKFVRTENITADYASANWMQAAWYDYDWASAPIGVPKPDEGYFKDTTINPDHGRYMPGIDNPYSSNAPQPFSKFNAETGKFEANMIPLTGIDDSGRVNPYPLLRVEAVDKNAGSVAAKVDAVSSAGSDFHCRECHAKGKIAAKSNAQKTQENLTPYTKDAYYSTAWASWYYAPKPIPEQDKLEEPPFKDVADFNGDPNSLFDQEYAASFNYSSIHDFYDGMYFTPTILNGYTHGEPGPVAADSPHPCYGCHMSQQEFAPFNRAWWDEFDSWNLNSPSYAPNYSLAMHRFHGQLQWNADKTDIKRDARGVYERWDWAQGPNNKKSTSLFPIFADDGVTQLPMEENCNRCHAGHREQFYRDRMYTAGVSCYDCHGDMLAVGEAYPKDYANHKDKLNSQVPNDYRVPWFDEPDCGSCHVGSGNVGKDASNGFFSAGVKKRAFDDAGVNADWSATSRAVDLKDPDAGRFAVVPRFQKSYSTMFMGVGPTPDDNWAMETVDTAVDAPLFREGKDTHGDVPCAACHGAAHAVWPNRDPGSNDNVTALQLQGHTGTILECNVCHTSDSFKNLIDLDGGRFMTDQIDSGLLGGPHNMHPVDDPFWWKSADGDTPNSDGKTYGGWHNDYAKKGGKKGEDQCAACHGNDRLGTRLSKTPVDRTFDFSKFDMKKLKKAGFKSKVVKVKAGSFIGCNTCHSVATSCKNSPFAGCGTSSGFVNSSPNHSPSFAEPVVETTAVIGSDFTWTAAATDQDGGDTVTYGLGNHPHDMTIDAESGVVSFKPWNTDYLMDVLMPYRLTFVVTASDGRGGWANQNVAVTLNCPTGKTWVIPDPKKGVGVCQ